MKATHLFEDQYYLISNSAVHESVIFTDDSIRLFMLEKMEHYLKDIIEICHFLFLPNEFQLLVKTKSREDYISFYQDKYDNQSVEEFFIPKSTYIISQQMANLQVSLVKFVNKKLDRNGTLFSGRYKKYHIESAEDYEKVLNEMKAKEEEFLAGNRLVLNKDLLSSRKIYEEVSVPRGLLECFRIRNIGDLRGQFEIVSENSFQSKYFYNFIKNYRKKYPLIRMVN